MTSHFLRPDSGSRRAVSPTRRLRADSRSRDAVAAIVTGLLIAGCARPAPEDVESQTVVPVSVAQVETGSITVSIHASGLVTPAPGAELIVVAPESARITAIPKAEGDTVRRGDVLVRFEIPSTQAEASKQRTEIGRAQARLTNARAALTRANDLFERGVAARKEVEEATREVADAEADLASAQAGAAAADVVASRSVVHATFDGVVAKRSHNAGDLVEASASDAVLRVIDPRRLEVQASIPIGDAPAVKVGASARLADVPAGSPAAVLKVVSRPVFVEPGTASVPVRLAFAAPARYPAGTPVQVEIDTETKSGVMLVPASAIVHEGEETAVFVVSGETANRRAVMIGSESADRAEVISGVKPGETVIVSGQNGLPDGAKVSIAK